MWFLLLHVSEIPFPKNCHLFLKCYFVEKTTEICYICETEQNKSCTLWCLTFHKFSLESVCSHSPRLKSPAQTNRGNWNCLFGETQITKGCFSYIMKSEAHCLSIVSCFAGVLKAFSPPLSPCKPGYRGLRTVRLSHRQIGWVSGRRTAGSSFLGSTTC